MSRSSSWSGGLNESWEDMANLWLRLGPTQVKTKPPMGFMINILFSHARGTSTASFPKLRDNHPTTSSLYSCSALSVLK